MSYRVRLSRSAQRDLDRLFDVVLERELAREGGNLELAERALDAVRGGLQTLRATPFTCRKAGRSPCLRELVIPFGGTGCVALFEIGDAAHVVILAVRHQLEDDCH